MVLHIYTEIEWVTNYLPEEVVPRKRQGKVGKVLHYDMMSSEESGKGSEGQKDYIIVKTLP